MKRRKIHIPSGTLTNEEIELVIGKLAMCGYSVRKGKYKDGEFKGIRYIEFWIEEEEMGNG